MTKNRTPTPVYLDPGMHPGLEVKGLRDHHISDVKSVNSVLDLLIPHREHQSISCTFHSDLSPMPVFTLDHATRLRDHHISDVKSVNSVLDFLISHREHHLISCTFHSDLSCY